MKLFRLLALAGIAASASACGDLEVVNLNDPDRERAITTPADVESLVSGSFASWWGGGHYNGFGLVSSKMADISTSSWGNFAWREMSSEPRVAYNNAPSASYAYANRDPWRYNYRALSGVRDGIIAITEGGVDLGTGGEDNHRALTFAAFVQGLSLGHLALTFDQAFIIDETTDLNDPANLPQLEPYDAVMAAALAKLDLAIQMAGSGSFEIPSEWVGLGGIVSNTRLAQLAHAYKARFMASVGRTPAERQAANWAAILQEANQGHTTDFYTQHDDVNFAWDRSKVHGGHLEGWTRVDLELIGRADADDDWVNWVATDAPERQPFTIDTDDRRITNGSPTGNGTLIRYRSSIPFPAARGSYHFSNYANDYHRQKVPLTNYVGENGEFPVAELDYLKAEAMIRTNNAAGALGFINPRRAAAGLPAATVDGVSGARCVPRKRGTGACGSLEDVLHYEKHIEVWHFGYATNFFDARGWGELSPGTALQMPVPGSELDLLLMDIYTFGGAGGESSAPRVFTDALDPETIRWKREALDEFDAAAQATKAAGVVR